MMAARMPGATISSPSAERARPGCDAAPAEKTGALSPARVFACAAIGANVSPAAATVIRTRDIVFIITRPSNSLYGNLPSAVQRKWQLVNRREIRAGSPLRKCSADYLTSPAHFRRRNCKLCAALLIIHHAIPSSKREAAWTAATAHCKNAAIRFARGLGTGARTDKTRATERPRCHRAQRPADRHSNRAIRATTVCLVGPSGLRHSAYGAIRAMEKRLPGSGSRGATLAGREQHAKRNPDRGGFVQRRRFRCTCMADLQRCHNRRRRGFAFQGARFWGPNRRFVRKSVRLIRLPNPVACCPARRVVASKT